MPGGVDIHSHIVGPKVNAVRKMQPELSMVRSHESPISRNVRPDWRLGGNRTAPTIVDTGYKYLGLGYTTAMDAAIAPSAARAVHSELEQFPGLDAGFFTLVGNHHFLLECAARGDQAAATHFLGWLLDRCGAFAPKVVNPGGVENFKRHREGNARDLDATIDGFGTTPRAVIQLLARSAAELKLPHPLHIHCNNLGLPGNWQTTLETMRSLDGNAAHFAHIQFHSYGGAGESETAFRSQVQPLADYVNTHPEITVDVGPDEESKPIVARLEAERAAQAEAEAKRIAEVEYAARQERARRGEAAEAEEAEDSDSDSDSEDETEE